MASMRFLGIDYGSKRVGIAVSDDEGRVAFPKTVLENGKSLLTQTLSLIKEEAIARVIIGSSFDFGGEENAIMEGIKKFVEELQSGGVDIRMEPEFLTTQEAKRIDESKENIDARAAALILQSYLDRERDNS